MATEKRRSERKKVSLYKELQHRIRQFSAIHKVNKVILSTLKIDQVLEMITKRACQIMEADVCSLRLLDETGENLELVATYGHSKEYIRRKKTLKLQESLAGLAAIKKKAVAITDVQKDSRYTYPHLAKEAGLRSLLSVPLIVKDKVIGVLNVYTKKQRHFSASEKNLLCLFADQTAIAIENARLFKELHDGYLDTVKTLGAIHDMRDRYATLHSEKVTRYALAIAQEMNLPEEEIEKIRYASYLHDIGKIPIDLDILYKPDKLSKEEWTEIISHPITATNIIGKIGFLKDIVPIILHHHERYNGKGYPSGIKKEEPPLASRILAVADAFQAMTSERAYRPAMSREEAIKELKRCSGTQFDPKVVKAFLKVLKRKGE